MLPDFERFLGIKTALEAMPQTIAGLESELRNHQGEFVLMVVRRWQRMAFGQPGSESRIPHMLVENFYLGVITKPGKDEPFLKFDGSRFPNFRISTEKHVQAGEPFGPQVVTLGEGQTWDVHTDLVFLNRPVGERPDKPFRLSSLEREQEGELALEIVIGDGVVKDWFLNQAQYERMPARLRQFIEDPKTSSEEVSRAKEMSFNPDLLILFQRMQTALGREITSLSPEIQAQVEAEVLRKKEQVLSSLEASVKKEIELTKELAQIGGIKLPRISVDLLEDDQYEREVQQDEADLRIWKSIPVSEKRRRVQGQIKMKLQEAIELKMHKDPWVILREPRPGYEIKIDVPTLIRGYCEYYEIPIFQESLPKTPKRRKRAEK